MLNFSQSWFVSSRFCRTAALNSRSVRRAIFFCADELRVSRSAWRFRKRPGSQLSPVVHPGLAPLWQRECLKTCDQVSEREVLPERLSIPRGDVGEPRATSMLRVLAADNGTPAELLERFKLGQRQLSGILISIGRLALHLWPWSAPQGLRALAWSASEAYQLEQSLTLREHPD